MGQSISTLNMDYQIKRTLAAVSKLPKEKAGEVADFAEFILKRHDDEIVRKGIENLVANSNPYNFLRNEEDIYTVADLKEKYR